jgi:hypothetical protein
VRSAGAASTLLLYAAQWSRSFTRASKLARRAQLGIAIVIGVIVHVLLQWFIAPSPGWMWLIVPGFAGAAGLLLFVTGWIGALQESRRA